MLSLGVWTSMGALFPPGPSRIKEGQDRDWECPRCHTGWLCPPPPPPTLPPPRPQTFPCPLQRPLHSLRQCSCCRGEVRMALGSSAGARCPSTSWCSLELGLCSGKPSPACPTHLPVALPSREPPCLVLALGLPPSCAFQTQPKLSCPVEASRPQSHDRPPGDRTGCI